MKNLLLGFLLMASTGPAQSRELECLDFFSQGSNAYLGMIGSRRILYVVNQSTYNGLNVRRTGLGWKGDYKDSNEKAIASDLIGRDCVDTYEQKSYIAFTTANWDLQILIPRGLEFLQGQEVDSKIFVDRTWINLKVVLRP